MHLAPALPAQKLKLHHTRSRRLMAVHHILSQLLKVVIPLHTIAATQLRKHHTKLAQSHTRGVLAAPAHHRTHNQLAAHLLDQHTLANQEVVTQLTPASLVEAIRPRANLVADIPPRANLVAAILLNQVSLVEAHRPNPLNLEEATRRSQVNQVADIQHNPPPQVATQLPLARSIHTRQDSTRTPPRATASLFRRTRRTLPLVHTQLVVIPYSVPRPLRHQLAHLFRQFAQAVLLLLQNIPAILLQQHTVARLPQQQRAAQPHRQLTAAQLFPAAFLVAQQLHHRTRV